MLDKPSGITSNAALGRAKRLLGIRKAGHTGTLDPMASGLLVLCFGEATKVSGFLLEADKAYRAEATLGVTTDSEDAEGQVLERRPVPELDACKIESVLDAFRGPIEQVPPMYSALKHKGKRLYKLARAGEVVERPPRSVVIHELTQLDWSTPKLSLNVQCSKGTYIRSLIRDIGEDLGCGAHLSALRRTASAPFSIERAITLDALEAADQDQSRAKLLAPDLALHHLPAVELDSVQARQLRQGQVIASVSGRTGQVRVYTSDEFVGIAELNEAKVLKPKRLFASSMSAIRPSASPKTNQ